jgi:hypothetical protein
VDCWTELEHVWLTTVQYLIAASLCCTAGGLKFKTPEYQQKIKVNGQLYRNEIPASVQMLQNEPHDIQ